MEFKFSNRIIIEMCPSNFATIERYENYYSDGTQKIVININPDITEMIVWFKDFKELARKEEKLLAKNPALLNMYKEYQCMLKLVSEEDSSAK